MRLTTFICSTAVFAGLFLVGCSQEAPPPPVNIQPAKVLILGEQFRRTREIPGTVRAAQRSDLSFQVPGKIVEFSLKEGQNVTEGDVLGKLDDSLSSQGGCSFLAKFNLGSSCGLQATTSMGWRLRS